MKTPGLSEYVLLRFAVHGHFADWGFLSDEESEAKDSSSKDDAMDVDGDPNTQPKNDPDDLSAYKLDEYDDDPHSTSTYIVQEFASLFTSPPSKIQDRSAI